MMIRPYSLRSRCPLRLCGDPRRPAWVENPPYVIAGFAADGGFLRFLPGLVSFSAASLGARVLSAVHSGRSSGRSAFGFQAWHEFCYSYPMGRSCGARWTGVRR